MSNCVLWADGRAVCKRDARRQAARVWQFVGNLLDSQIAHRSHEPGRDALPRVQADQQVGPTGFMRSTPPAPSSSQRNGDKGMDEGRTFISALDDPGIVHAPILDSL